MPMRVTTTAWPRHGAGLSRRQRLEQVALQRRMTEIPVVR
jgi:hypothetical protein